MIRVALQAKGRLNEDSLRLFSEAGIRFENAKRKLLSKSEDFPIEVLYLRDDDIPSAVSSGVADIGFVGINEIEEKGFDVEVVHKLGWGKCRISLAIAKSEEYTDISWFNGKRVATSYPNILKKFFNENGIDAVIEEIAGSVEIAPAVGMADAIFDIVSSGSTLVSNGLKEVHTVMKSEAALIATVGLSGEKRELLEQLKFRFESVERSEGKKYILFNIPNDKIDEALEIIPSLKSPTLLPLANKSWSSIHAVVEESVLWSKINLLKGIGAEDILVLSLEMMVL
ncbi:MAG: ATP phosphoribosyltransferase [Rikenellaceae bacterium]